jgi:DNA-binding PadR family transcriptional regulator
MLRAMENDGWIVGREEKAGAHRRFYRITPKGRAALKEARTRLRELFHESATEEGQSESRLRNPAARKAARPAR